MFHMSNDSHLFRTHDELEAEGFHSKGTCSSVTDERYLPLYEAKMLHHFDHRFGDYSMRAKGSQDTRLPDVPTIGWTIRTMYH